MVGYNPALPGSPFTWEQVQYLRERGMPFHTLGGGNGFEDEELQVLFMRMLDLFKELEECDNIIKNKKIK